MYQHGVDWEADREARIERSERCAWRVASCACVVAIVAVIGIASLAPLRRTVPYLFALEKATGNVEYIGAIDDRRISGYQELLDKHWAQRYVIARESYNYRLLQGDYDTALGMSDEHVGRDFARLYEGANARDARYGAGAEIKVTVLSVQLSRGGPTAQAVVRFMKSLRRTDAEFTDPPQYFIATVAYEYRPTMAGKEKELLSNPLGFRVVGYRIDAEIAQVPSNPARSAAQ